MSGAKFGTAQEIQVKPCAICGEDVKSLDNRLVVEKETIHQTCFTCAFCDTRLQMGYCVIDLSLYDRFGPCWYCTLICAHKPTNEKVAKLLEKGRKQKGGGKPPSTAGTVKKSPSPQPPPVPKTEEPKVPPAAEPLKGPTEKGPLLNVFAAEKK